MNASLRRHHRWLAPMAFAAAGAIFVVAIGQRPSPDAYTDTGNHPADLLPRFTNAGMDGAGAPATLIYASAEPIWPGEPLPEDAQLLPPDAPAPDSGYLVYFSVLQDAVVRSQPVNP